MAATITLNVPGSLRYRDLAVRFVGDTARMVSEREGFDTAVVAAFAEIFNNVAIHAYERSGGGAIEIAITPNERELIIEVRDHGRPFVLGDVPPLPNELDADSLPEGGMGIHIAKTMLDQVTYEPGPPNLWRLCKRLPGGANAVSRV